MRAGDLLRQFMALINSGLPASQAMKNLQPQLTQLQPVQLNQFQAVWSLATELGGPVNLALGRLASVFDKADNNALQAQLAFAAPQATARLVTWLPAIALGLAQLVGLDPMGSIFHAPVATFSVILGSALLYAGSWWSKKMLKKANVQQDDPGSFLDSVVIALHAGLPISDAKQKAENAVKKNSAYEINIAAQAALNEAIELSRNTGAAIVELLIAAADRLRENLQFESSAKIARLSVRLMLPLGLTVLPAFVLLSIVPIAIGLLSNN